MKDNLINYNKPKSIFDLVFNNFDLFNDFDFNTNTSNVKTNLIETDENYQLDVIIPGFKKEDIKIDIENNILTISSEIKSETKDNGDDNYVRQEYIYSSFVKRFTLPKNIIVDDIQAKHENGILSLTIPKNEKQNTKKQIVIK